MDKKVKIAFEGADRFQKLFFLSYYHAIRTENLSGFLFVIDFVLIPINLLSLIMTKWRIRLI